MRSLKYYIVKYYISVFEGSPVLLGVCLIKGIYFLIPRINVSLSRLRVFNPSGFFFCFVVLVSISIRWKASLILQWVRLAMREKSRVIHDENDMSYLSRPFTYGAILHV